MSRLRPNTVRAYFVEKVRPDWACVTCMPRSNSPETTRMNARVSRWFLSMPAWTLNTTPEKSSPTSRCSSIAAVETSTAFGSEARPSGAGAMAHSVSLSLIHI